MATGRHAWSTQSVASRPHDGAPCVHQLWALRHRQVAMYEHITPVAAATVVLIRDGVAGLETLLLRRNAALQFAGGSWVFPGGRIDPHDYAASEPQNITLAARNASVREAQEETSLQVATDDLQYLSHWTTPPIMPRRFATWFFLAAVAADAPEVAVDGGEIHEHRWFTPELALAAQRAGQILLMPPTFVTLQELSARANVAAVLQWLRQHQPRRFEPRFVDTPGGKVALYDGDAGYAGSNPQRPGRRHRLSMRNDGWCYENDANEQPG